MSVEEQGDLEKCPERKEESSSELSPFFADGFVSVRVERGLVGGGGAGQRLLPLLPVADRCLLVAGAAVVRFCTDSSSQDAS